jgi:hypothetical protein
VVAYVSAAFRSMGIRTVDYPTANTAGSSCSASHVVAAQFVCTVSGGPCVEPAAEAASVSTIDCATAVEFTNAKNKNKNRTLQCTSMASCRQVGQAERGNSSSAGQSRVVIRSQAG